MSIKTDKSDRPFGLLAIVLLEIMECLLLLTALYLPLLDDADIYTTIAVFNEDEILLLSLRIMSLGIVLGLWRLKRWAWLAFMIYLGVSMAVDLGAYLMNMPNYLSMLKNVAVVFYLNQTEVRSLFEQQRTERTVEHHIL